MNLTSASPSEDRVLAYLREHAVTFQRCEHPAVFTVAQAEELVPTLPGAKAKNLFLRDVHSQRLFLVVVPYAKRVDLAGLARALGLRKLTFGAPEALLSLLGVTPGAVSLLGLLHDRDRQVQLVIDAATWAAPALQCHPGVNTATVSIAHADLQRFLQATGHEPTVMDVPARAEDAAG